MSANTGLDIANLKSPIDKLSAEILQDPEAVFRFDGELIHLVAHHGLSAEGAIAYERQFPMAVDRRTAIGRAIQDREVAEIPDIEADAEYGALKVARAVT